MSLNQDYLDHDLQSNRMNQKIQIIFDLFLNI